MIARNVQVVLQAKGAAEMGLTEKDVKQIKEEGVKEWLKDEFGVKDTATLDSAYESVIAAAPEIAELEKKGPDVKKPLW